jgi:hypothetical protein
MASTCLFSAEAMFLVGVDYCYARLKRSVRNRGTENGSIKQTILLGTGVIYELQVLRGPSIGIDLHKHLIIWLQVEIWGTFWGKRH